MLLLHTAHELKRKEGNALGRTRRDAKHTEDRRPPGPDALGARLHHLVEALQHHFLGARVGVATHCVLERLQEVLLEREVEELFLLEKLARELPERVEAKCTHGRVRMATHMVEVLAENCPQTRPLHADAPHVVVGDLDDLLQREQPRIVRHAGALDLLPRHVTQRLHKVYDRLAGQLGRGGKHPVSCDGDLTGGAGLDHVLMRHMRGAPRCR